MNVSKQSKSIILGFSFLLILMSALIFISLSRMKIMQVQLNSITQQHIVKTSLLETMRAGIFNRQVSLRNIMLMPDPFDKDEEKTVFNKYALSVLIARNKIEKMTLSNEEKHSISLIKNAMQDGYKYQQKILREIIFSENPTQFQPLLNDAFQKQENIINLINTLKSALNNQTSKAVDEAHQSYKNAKNAIYIIGTIAIILGLIITIITVSFSNKQTLIVNKAMIDLKESHDLLEQRVKSRTEQLAIARDEALAFNHAKNVFLANMSHELRTPMNAIIGYSELLEEDASDSNNAIIPDLQKIQASAKHLLNLINGLLDLSKIDAGKMDIDPIDFDISELIKEVCATINPLLDNNRNKLVNLCPETLDNIYADNMRLRQIILNLLSNAIKFTHDGTITITADQYQNEGNSWISISISDTGIGIASDYLSKLFEDFSQEDASTTRKYGGTGLGLTISRRLSKLMNGNITVKSQQGIGSTFTITLPASQADTNNLSVVTTL